jgi:hypothetical protein
MRLAIPLLLSACTPPGEPVASDGKEPRVEPAPVNLAVGAQQPVGQQFVARGFGLVRLRIEAQTLDPVAPW